MHSTPRLPFPASLALTGSLVLWSFMLGGCDPSLQGLNGLAENGTAWVDVAQGEHIFGDLQDGDVLEVERGSQGGMHIWGSLLTAGVKRGSTSDIEALINGDRPMIEFFLENEEGNLAEDNGMHEWLDDMGDGSLRLVGRRVVFRHFAELPENWQELDYAEVEAEIEAQDLQFGVRILDAAGQELVDSRSIRLLFPPRGNGGEEQALGR